MKNRKLKSIFSQCGLLFMLFGILLSTPIISLIWYPEEYLFYLNFIIPGSLFFCVGFILNCLYKKEEMPVLRKSETVLLVVSTWILTCVTLSIPFMTSGYLNFSQAFFETSSGLSTTGLSVVDVTSVEKMLLVYRSLIQFYGGIGIILILVTIFSTTLGVELFQTEGHGDHVLPNLKGTSKTIIKIYVLYMVIGFVLLVISGMPTFDAFNIAICAVATGGFAVTPDSIAAYDSYLINLVIMVLMILGSFSFYTNQFVINGKIKKVFAIDEVKLFFKIILILVAISVTFTLFGEFTLFDSLNIAFFEILSAITGTGFAITDYSILLVLNQTMFFVMIVAMIIGGAVGSTAGGIKITRLNIIFSSLKWNIKKMYVADNRLVSRSIVSPKGKIRLGSQDIILAANYILLYLTILVFGTLIFTAYGYAFNESLFEFASALGNVGLSIGITSPTLPSVLLWVLSIAMFIGRLEIFLVIVFILKLREFIKNSLKREEHV